MEQANFRERPILFSAPMVRAILAGNKTQTRRVIKPVRGFERHDICKPDMAADPWAVWWHGDQTYMVGCLQECPYGKPGDRLWVRETIELKHLDGNNFPSPVYQADSAHVMDNGKRASNHEFMGRKVHPSIHMPRWASRITLEITSVRVERLQDISEEDAEAEGITGEEALIGQVANPFRTAFADLWFTIHSAAGPNGWANNPWVWVVEFRRVKP